MKMCLAIAIGLLIVSCSFSDKRSVSDLSELFKAWDTITFKVLRKESNSSLESASKAAHIASTIIKENGVDLLGRDAFLITLQHANKINIDFGKKFMIIEFVNSAEKLTNQKFLIDLTKESDNCYSFIKDVKGNWRLYKTNNMEETKIHNFMSIPLQTKDQFWGNGINDVLLISIFNESDIKVKPVIFLSQDELREVRSSLP